MGSQQPDERDRCDESIQLDRRTCLKATGAAVASLTTAGCTGQQTIADETVSNAAVGYGGTPTVEELITVPDPFAAMDGPESDPAEPPTRISPDGTSLRESVPTEYGLFSVGLTEGTEFVVTVDVTDVVGAAVVGVFEPDGTVVEQVYAGADAPVYLPATASENGDHYLQIVGLDGSQGTYELSVSTTETASDQEPYSGSASSVPGRIEAENFDIGGEEVAYHDTTDGSEYDISYRDSSVDIRETDNENGGYVIGYFEDGEWLEYTVDPTPGRYDVVFSVATTRENRQLRLTVDGAELGTVDVPVTGSWREFTTVTLSDVVFETDETTTLRVEAVGSGIDFDYMEFEARQTQAPYDGSAAPVPGRIQVERFDRGGEGVAYHDTTDGSEYDTDYRDTDVDIRETQDVDGGYAIGFVEDGEWLEYTVDPTAGTYDLRVRLATARSGNTLRVSLDGTELGTIDVPNTGGWRDWQTVTVDGVDVETDATGILRLEAVGSGIDLNWIEFERVERQTPFGDTVATIPGRIQVERFDRGGEGVAYHDTTDGNEYDTDYRDSAVDIRETQDVSGAYTVGYVEDGEWLEYTVDPTAGTYDLRLRVASARSGNRLRVSLDGTELGTIDVPNTGGWRDWQTVTVDGVDVETDATGILRLEAIGSGIDLNWIEFERVEQQTQTPYDGSAAPVPGRIEAENFDVGSDGEAYNDTTDGNEYDTDYRDSAVDIRETQDVSGAYTVGYVEDGEWLEYTIDPTPGNYVFRARIASARDDARLVVSVDGTELGTIDVPNTGSWTDWETVTVRDVTLETDQPAVLRVEAEGAGPDLNWFEFVEDTDNDYGELGYGDGKYGSVTE